jgi:alpha-beta hydrolase superfamily lysophospholipase
MKRLRKLGLTLLDNPLLLSFLFHPRPARPGTHLPNVVDGTIPVEGDVVLGYRLYKYEPGEPVILYFHGNGEIASDYDDLADMYHGIGTSLLIVDYRGYGWSTGQPKVSSLVTDVEAVFAALPTVLEGLGNPPLFVMGRSLGSAPAIHLAHTHPEAFKGLILESGFAQILPLLLRLGLPAQLMSNLPDPIGNLDKIGEITLPLLVIHGERDDLIPVTHGQSLYDASPAEQKKILRIFGAGHNNLLSVGLQEYFTAIGDLLSAAR